MFFLSKEKLVSLLITTFFWVLFSPSSVFALVTLDPDFVSSYVPDGSLNNIVLQEDGKLVVTSAYSSSLTNHLVRLNADGTLDTNFVTNLGTGFSSTIFDNSLYIQQDGKILVGYSSDAEFNGEYLNTAVIRLNTDGTRDSDFNAMVNGSVYGYGIQSDGKIVVVGNNASSTYSRILRLNTDGSLDEFF